MPALNLRGDIIARLKIEPQRWHKLPEFIDLVSDIPPEKACRIYMGQGSVGTKSLAIQIHLGKRRMLLKAFSDLKRQGKVELAMKGFDKEIRLYV